MQTHTDDTIANLADTFAGILRDWFAPDEFAAMRDANARYAREGRMTLCASHDYCDANEAMSAAFIRVIGRDALLPTDGRNAERAEDMRAWNAAWDIAKARYLTAPDTSLTLHTVAMRHLVNVSEACARATTCNGHKACLRAYHVAMAHAKALVR